MPFLLKSKKLNLKLKFRRKTHKANLNKLDSNSEFGSLSYRNLNQSMGSMAHVNNRYPLEKEG